MPYRNHVNKNTSARSFRQKTRKTKKLNIAAPMRGGIRL